MTEYCIRMKTEQRCTLCGRQDERTISGKIYCSECAEKVSQSRKRIRQSRIESGLCTECGGPAEAGRTLCTACREYREAYKAAERECRAESGLCSRCGKSNDRISDGVCTCFECSKRMRESRNRTNERRKAAGLCVRCGGPNDKLDDGGITCSRCRERRNADNKKVREFRISSRLCTRCGRQLPDERSYTSTSCPECRASMNDYGMWYYWTHKRNRGADCEQVL